MTPASAPAASDAATKPDESPTARAKRGRKPASASTTANGKQTLTFDLETIPDYSRLELFGLDPLPECPPVKLVDELPPVADFLSMKLEDAAKALDGVNPHPEWLRTVELTEQAAPKPRKGMFDLVTKARGIQEAVDQAKADRIKLLSVTPEYCSICAMGWALGDDSPRAMVVGHPKGDGNEKITERDILEQFWQLVATCGPLVGFNCLGFDLPVIFVRSFILDVSPCRRLDTTPWKDDVIDLMAKRWPRGGQKGLKDLARILGFDVPAGDCEGSQVHDLWQAGELDKIAEYVRSDISITQALHRAYRGFWC